MSRGSRYRNEKKNIRQGKILAFIMLIIFILLLIISVVKVIRYIKDSIDNKNISNEITKNIVVQEASDNVLEEKYKIDFASLKKKNSDTCGFLKVNGTNIEQIVVKSTDNSYYLSHNFEKQSNSAGWIFADYRNKLDGTDKNIIIYGHNMKNDAMFGTLHNILEEEWQENEDNRYITYITENELSVYEVFSVYQIEVEDYYMKTDFNTGEFKKYVDTMKSRSMYNFDVEIDDEDSILTLSTCGNNNKYRVILHSKKYESKSENTV